MKETDELKLEQQQQLIPGLPNEIALDCLSRVPYRCHSQLKLVCQGWRNLLSNPSSYLLEYRKRVGKAEDFVCLVQAVNPTQTQITDDQQQKDDKRVFTPPVYALTIYNATQATWHRMPPTPLLPAGIPMFCHCLTLPSKLVLIGGWDPTTLDSVPDVYIYDFVSGGGWRWGAPMSTARSFFACAAIGSSIYVAGGHDNQKNALHSAEVYDVEANLWRSLPPMIEERDECQGVSCEGGRFWVVSGYGTERQGRFMCSAEWYDPVSGLWTKLEGVWPFGNSSPRASCSSGRTPSILFVDCGGREVKEYDEGEKKWKLVGSIPDCLASSSICMAPIGDRIFVMGTGGGGGGGEQKCHRACVLEKGSWKWTEVETPVNFSGFIYSACSLHL